ncbi:transmembrane signal receptor [Lithospermum erythrorhizon]|uniref:Transmembrane signal receptor n=1 Tax=Lithospermum erythrorhizon TaxID=34254 RepID=A0AAV3QA67_LITER
MDDIILVSSSDDLRTSIMTHLYSEFAMKDLGPLSYSLGISINRASDHIFLSQKKYATEIIEKARMSSCKSSSTVDCMAKLSSSSENYYHNPTEYRTHECIETYQDTLDYGLHLYPSSLSKLASLTDANWGDCPDTRRSTSGYCVYLGYNLISWSIKIQPTLSRSSAEAEYRGVANVVSESYWIRNLLLELRFPISTSTMVYCDNVSAVYLSGNPIRYQRTKYIEMDIHFVSEKVSRGQVRVTHVPSRYQIAVIFTKGLPLQLFDDFRSSLNVRPPPVSTTGAY